jgi:hypothetical protein
MRCLVLLAGLLCATPAWSQQDSSPAAQCEAAIATAEQNQALPAGLLGAIARVETGRFDPSLGVVRPWPWSINAAGAGQVFARKQDAVDAVRRLLDSGVRSIDVGCLQINLLHHPFAFATLDAAFDPAANAAYAARFLRDLFAESQDWTQAAAAYHSRTPDFAAPYRLSVLAAWGLGAWGLGAVPPGLRPAAPRRASLLPAGPPPPPRPFAPPPLPDDATAAPPDGAAQLLAQAPGCAVAPPSSGRSAWIAPARPASCGRSPFASASGLRSVLAAE